MIRAEETSENIYDNVDVVIPMLERQMRKVRTKIEKSYKSHDNGAISDDFADVPDLPELKPVRTKEFELKPLTVDAAIDQLTLLDHDFFLYLNPETGKVNVVYKRHKGDVGVIECIY
jgi:putative sigma-54 modulation protein